MNIVKSTTITMLILLSGCHKHIKVPTVEEFEKNPNLLNEWIKKCDSGEWKDSGEESQSPCDSARLVASAQYQKAAAEEATATLKKNLPSR